MPDGSFTYTPTPGLTGVDSFTYQASDGTNFSPPITVTLNVAANAAPRAAPDQYPVTPGAPLVVPAPGVLANDTDPESNPLTAVLASGPAHGTVGLLPDGSFTYTANPGFSGADSFTYQTSDGTNLSAPISVTLNVAAAGDTTGPSVVEFARFGFHAAPTTLALTFSEDLNAARAQDATRYRVFSPGRDGRIGTRDDVRVRVTAATYNAATRTVTLRLARRLYVFTTHRLTVDGTTAAGLTDVAGNRLAGGDYAALITRSTLRGTAAAARRQAAAIRARSAPHPAGPMAHATHRAAPGFGEVNRSGSRRGSRRPLEFAHRCARSRRGPGGWP